MRDLHTTFTVGLHEVNVMKSSVDIEYEESSFFLRHSKRAKRERAWIHPTRERRDVAGSFSLSPPRLAFLAFLPWGDFHAFRSFHAFHAFHAFRSLYYPWGKMGTRSLLETGFNTFILLPNRGRVRSIWEIGGLQSGRSLVLYLGWENYSGYEYNWGKKLLPFRYKRLDPQVALVTTKKCYSRLREGDV